jgi:hypothetical protein
MLLSVSTGVILLLPLLVAIEPMMCMLESEFLSVVQKVSAKSVLIGYRILPRHTLEKKSLSILRSTSQCDAVNAGTQSQMMQGLSSEV